MKLMLADADPYAGADADTRKRNPTNKNNNNNNNSDNNINKNYSDNSKNCGLYNGDPLAVLPSNRKETLLRANAFIKKGEQRTLKGL